LVFSKRRYIGITVTKVKIIQLRRSVLNESKSRKLEHVEPGRKIVIVNCHQQPIKKAKD
jgi:hypothetical protein